MKIITGKTSLVGLLGNPVEHSLSPIIHNSALEELGLDWTYLAMPCEQKNLARVTEALLNLNCKGLNITIPHKTNALHLCSHLSESSKKIGAINTLIPKNGESWLGENTDILGFTQPLKFQDWSNKNALVLGYGGSARAVIAGLEKLKFSEINIIGRNKDKLEKFLNDACKYSELKKNNLKINGYQVKNKITNSLINESDLIINTTPVGMSSSSNQDNNLDQLPFGKIIWENLKSNTILYDLIYSPQETPWLAYGKYLGCNCINGLEMLIEQGAESLRLWSGYEDIPVHIMRQAAKNYLTS